MFLLSYRAFIFQVEIEGSRVVLRTLVIVEHFLYKINHIRRCNVLLTAREIKVM